MWFIYVHDGFIIIIIIFYINGDSWNQIWELLNTSLANCHC
jgi:hypothetical protein